MKKYKFCEKDYDFDFSQKLRTFQHIIRGRTNSTP